MKKHSKKKALIHPYSKESLMIKENQLKILISLLEALLFLPIVGVLIEVKKNNEGEIIFFLLSYILLFLLFYLIKSKNKKYKFREWEFLDDEVQLISDKKLDGNISNFLVTKHIVLIAINVAVIIPISLTFSTIIASLVALVISVFVKNTIVVEMLKFVAIALVFKMFLAPINIFVVDNIKDKEELF